MSFPARVLVVEDDPDARGAREEVLASAGHTVKSVGDGRAALEVMSAWRPAIVVLDLMLPVMDGWQVLSVKRDEPSLAEIPAIVVSGNATAMASAVHAELYIVKPLDARTVLQVGSAGTDRLRRRRAPRVTPRAPPAWRHHRCGLRGARDVRSRK